MRHLKHKTKILIFLGCLFISLPSMAINWPQVIKTKNADITVYQPQIESIDGINVSGRAAISVKHDNKSPIFGAAWIDAVLQNDRVNRTSTLSNVNIPKIKFSDDVSDENINSLKELIKNEIPKWNWQIPTDQIITTYENDVNSTNDSYKNDAPEIITVYTPSMLVYIDGEPATEKIEGSKNLVQVINTPYIVLMDTKDDTYYIYGEERWYASNRLDGKYKVEQRPSAELQDIQQQIKEQSEENETSNKSDILNIIVRTHPAELLVINGNPKMSPIKNTNLLYVSNSDNYIFLDIDSQYYYVTLSGRWYQSKQLDGSWNYVSNNNLPSSFANIPEGSNLDVVLANIPGTEASRDAILDNAIPQTAEVSRKDASVTIEYDGTPIYRDVDGTSLQYVENSSQTILRDGNNYYCVDNGVWFVARNPNGPWDVATVRPQQVENIRPSSPVYNVKYVYIYDVTPDVVYVGYTPGYYGSYVYNHSVIYGTGYYYRPWRGRYYYSRPTTFGFNMSYNPWAGWSISYGWSYSGWFNTGWGYHHSHYCNGYWGARSYRPAYSSPHQSRGYYGHRSRPNYSTPRRSQNIYTAHRSGVRTTTATRVNTTNRRTSRNNVYTDRSGNVYQRSGNNWEQRNNSSWNRVSTRTSSGSSTRTSGATDRSSTTNRTTITNSNNRSGNSVGTTRSNSGSTNTPRTSTTSSSTNRSNSSSTPSRNSSSVNSTNFNRNNLQQAEQNRQRSQTRTSNYNRATNTRSNNSSYNKSSNSRPASTPSYNRSSNTRSTGTTRSSSSRSSTSRGR